MKNRTWIILIAVIAALCVGLGLLFFSPAEDADRAQIKSEGKILRIVDLKTDQEFTVDTPGGGHNVVTVKDGKIAVTEANCPDHYCMDRGFVGGGTPIVCLPNTLVIEFLGVQEVDGVVG